MRQVPGNFSRYLASLIAVSALVLQVQAVTIIKGTDFVCNGESFFQASNICSELSRLARADGVLASGDNFKQIAVSGAPIANILSFYKNCNPKPTYLVSDGAGIDLMNSSNISALSNTLKQYLDEMKKGGTKKLLWMIYPDPQGSNWANLKKNQDLWAVEVPKVMATITEPEVTLIDLRPVWAGKYSQYTSDGIHCTSAGGTATAEAFWKAIKAAKWFETTSNRHENASTRSSAQSMKSIVASKGNAAVSLSVDQPTSITLKLTTVSGRSVYTAQRQTTVSGMQTIVFPLGTLARGLYCSEVTTGQMTSQSKLLVQ